MSGGMASVCSEPLAASDSFNCTVPGGGIGACPSSSSLCGLCWTVAWTRMAASEEKTC